MAPSSDQIIAVSTICVGVGHGGTTNMLARVAVCDYRGQVLFERFVRPTMEVEDYRTASTGITRADVYGPNAWDFRAVQTHLATLFRGKVIVGHSLWQDLSVLGVPINASSARDVALYKPFRSALTLPHQVIGLQTLAWQLMSRRCQEGQLHPLENARAAIDLYRSDADAWENFIERGIWPCLLPPPQYSRCFE